MKSVEKESFLLLLKVRPGLLIGKEIIYKEKTVKILDVSVGGDFMFLESISTSRSWEPVDGLGDTVIVDVDDFPVTKNNRFTVVSLTSNIDTLEKLIGQPGSEQTKCLFEIVEALNKEVLELKFKIREIEKSKTYNSSSR